MFIKENRISMLFYLFKRKSMKITNCHRHIAKSEYQLCIAVQAHDTSLFTSEDTTGNTDFLLFLKMILQRAIHQLDIIGHRFIQIDQTPPSGVEGLLPHGMYYSPSPNTGGEAWQTE